MVFRAQKNININMSSVWEDTGSNDVRFVLFLNGSEVRYITFNGFSTTKDSWFNQSLVLSSTWTGLKTDNLVGYFRLKGLTSNKTVRRFNIRNDQQQDCSFYASYVTGVDFNGDVCAPEWNLITAYFPQFLYSLNTNSMAVFSKLPKAYGFADVLGVFVLF
ncbi:hypothetical protein Btru_043774 [Bulinus truncatus]|nr:hypothetical protein Btru_043774 [Bulinus truncatus]